MESKVDLILMIIKNCRETKIIIKYIRDAA